jgi:hypothetical protein
MNKKTLWVFGDSNSAYFDVIYPYAKQYLDYKGYAIKIYGEIIAEGLGMEHINKAIPGSDNYSIFQSFCDNVEKIQKGDVVVIGWSAVLRFRLVTDEPTNKWLPLIPNWDNNMDGFEFISQQTIDEILVNRADINYSNEVNSWITLINHILKLKGVKVCNWSLFYDKLDALEFDFMQPGYTIYSETNGKIVDYHLAELGHEELAKYILRHTIKALV